MSVTHTREERFYQSALAENYKQVEKWGIQHHNIHKWLAILMEEVGEAAKASIDYPGAMPDVRQVLAELTQVAAVTAAIACDLSWQTDGQ